MEAYLFPLLDSDNGNNNTWKCSEKLRPRQECRKAHLESLQGTNGNPSEIKDTREEFLKGKNERETLSGISPSSTPVKRTLEQLLYHSAPQSKEASISFLSVSLRYDGDEGLTKFQTH